jgi:ferrous iron transport protein A
LATLLQQALWSKMFNSIIALWAGPGRAKRRDKSAFEPSDTTFALSLDQAKSGERVRVLQIVAGRTATRQLAQLGIQTGATLTVQRSAPLGGPILVESAGSSVAIGRGLASKVSVRIVK